ncbi:D-ribose pyranase [Marinitoga hydrogenitolerans DSM 16785]|uniref:D-ribose pyranase n=1 Tax=Marinitoga hydrogenitolerans (strain DSM 16785 / JCM 12826 / AT1271) TaxID=1122195 RepID=A0A1M4VI76_MARH1|nr:D-ribose pyranase [Marinitoga hydrogenitolerans]SHE68557.1 D-ribose pyranase [Marinitoga hydrogenitolerans DSM 16785]
MKKTGIFNSEISSIVASMGHTDKIAVVDMGFPISNNVKKIDLVVDKGIPSLEEVVKSILKELSIEKIIIAKESSEEFISMMKKINKNIEIVSHEELKKIANNSKAVVRTGEVKPYFNAIFVSGVIF